MTKPKAKAKIGRPTDYTPELAAEMCARSAEGASYRSICADPNMPAGSTFFVWKATYPEFAKMWDAAQEVRAFALVEEAKEILDDGSADYTVKSRRDGGEDLVVDHEHIRRSEARANHLRWMASKLNRRAFGERQTLEHTDPDGNNPFAGLMEAVAANGRPRPGSG